MGGMLSIVSVAGEGTSVTLTVPRADQTKGAEPSKEDR